MSYQITLPCNGFLVTLQAEVLSVRPVSGTAGEPLPDIPGDSSSGSLSEKVSFRTLPDSSSGSLPDPSALLPGEKGGEKESEKKVTQRKEKEKDPERESASLASQLARIAEAWNSLPLKKVVRFTGQRKERVKALLALYPEEEVIRTIYSVSRSRFLLGGGARHWQVRFDWFILPENFSKVREGNYLDEDTAENAAAGLQYSEQDLQAIGQVWPESNT